MSNRTFFHVDNIKPKAAADKHFFVPALSVYIHPLLQAKRMGRQRKKENRMKLQ